MSSAATTRWGSSRLDCWPGTLHPRRPAQRHLDRRPHRHQHQPHLPLPQHPRHAAGRRAGTGGQPPVLGTHGRAGSVPAAGGILFYIGTRSVDPGEEEILAAHNIRTVRMPEIQEKGIELCARELLDAVKTPYIHLSFDVDFLDAAANSGPPACRFLTVLSARGGPSGHPYPLWRPARLLGGLCGVQPPARHRWQRGHFPPVCRCFRKSSMRCQKNNLPASRLAPPNGDRAAFLLQKKRGLPGRLPLFVSSAYSSVLSSGSGARKMMSSRLAASPCGQHRRFADDGATGLLGQHLQRVQRLAGADDVVHQQHPLAL